MTDPERILSGYESKLAAAQRNSDAIRETLTGLRVTERSADGQITVTVNDAGNLVDLRLGNSLQRRDGTAVGQEVLRVVQAAQSRVAVAVQEVMTPVLGGDSEAMHFMLDKLRSAQPPPPPTYTPGHGGWGAGPQPWGVIEDDAPPPRPRAPQPPPRRPAPPDDEDFGDRGLLR